jgi:hypothetical protein
MPKYRCLLMVRVLATDGISYGEREIVLPFAPITGTELRGAFLDPADDDESGPLDVMYDVNDNVFILGQADDTAFESGFTMNEARELYHPGFTWEDSPYDRAIPESLLPNIEFAEN